jgi:aldehyde:ferredoxin oxidoreductase
MNGWTGNIIRVDLSSGDFAVEDLDMDLAKEYIGGQGIATRMLYDEIDPEVDALDPENELIFSTGPLTGVGAISGSRYMVVTKSPLSGTITVANSGGYFGPELKFAGYDMIIFEGKADSPVYLNINDDDIELRDASHLWGKTVHETEDLIREEIENKWEANEVCIASIGPAGENLVKIASIMNDKHRAAARNGVGAVMGSKNLKAIAVRGTKDVNVADKEGLIKVTKELFKKMKANPIMAHPFPAYGTSGLLSLYNEFGIFPSRNFQRGVDELSFLTSGQALAEQHLIKTRGCFACPVACGRVTEVKGPPKFKGLGEGPEYESLCLFGANCGIHEFPPILKANYLCNELGMDTIGMGNTMSCAMELYEKGFISSEEAGYNLNFGNADAMVELVRKTAYREDFGDVLAEGSYRMAEKYGHPEISMSVKKSEVPGYEPRSAQGMGLGFATSITGANHCRNFTLFVEFFGSPVKLDPLETTGKALWTMNFQDLTAIADATGLCLFSLMFVELPEILSLLEVVTGAGFTMETLAPIGERIWNLQKLFNLKAGITKEDDTLPDRFLKEPTPAGPGKGNVVELDKMLKEFYQVRGWDENGEPTEEKLSQLGLEK